MKKEQKLHLLTNFIENKKHINTTTKKRVLLNFTSVKPCGNSLFISWQKLSKCLLILSLILNVVTKTNANSIATTVVTYEEQDGQSNSNIYVDENLRDYSWLTSTLNTLMKSSTSKRVLHLFSHGKTGHLYIENEWKNDVEIAEWITEKYALSEIKSLNIYGCEFAKGEKGKRAILYLEKKLNIQIAASDDITGQDGDWDLEVGQTNQVFAINEYAYNLQDCCYSGQPQGHMHPKRLKLKYVGSGTANIVFRFDDSNGAIHFSGNVASGGSFIVDGTGMINKHGQEGLETDTWYSVNGSSGSFHTSCSQNLNVGDIVNGLFEVLAIEMPLVLGLGGVSCTEGTFCPDAGTNGTLSSCANNLTTTKLFNALAGTPTSGGIWSPALNGAGTYTYTHPAANSCPASSAQVVVTTNNGPDKDNDGVSDDCDLDDDNDGILDTNEGLTVSNANSEVISWTNSQLDALPTSFNTTMCGKQVNVNVVSGTYASVAGESTVNFNAAATLVENAPLSVTDYLQIRTDPGQDWVIEFDITPGDFEDLTLYLADLDDDTPYSNIGIEVFSGATALPTTGWTTQTMETNGNTPASDPPLVATTTNKMTLTSTTNGVDINNDVIAISFPLGTLSNANKIRVTYPPSASSTGQYDFIRMFLSSSCLTTTTSQDTDGDGIPDFCDTDSDNDGCPDAIEGGANFTSTDLDSNDRLTGNVDANGVPTAATSTGQNIGDSQNINVQDVDCSNPPNPCIPTISNPDSDSDGLADVCDLDDDNDGILDTVEGTGDIDGDGIPNSLDLDSDNDGCPDAIEGGATFTNTNLDANDRLTGSVDANGIPIVATATGQNIGDSQNINVQDVDCSNPPNPCIPTISNPDSDSDGLADVCDLDDDNDGIFDTAEGTDDIDGDGIPNSLDLDSDNDGCPDAKEGSANFTSADIDNNDRLIGNVDNNGIPVIAGGAGQTVNISQDATMSNCPEICNNGIDDDGDGLIDCADSDCGIIATANFSNETCSQNNGSITISFLDNLGQTDIEFSIDGGSTWSYTTPDNVGAFMIHSLSSGTYDLRARWDDNSCPITIDNNIVITNNGTQEACNPSILFHKSVNMDTARMNETVIYTFTITNNTGASLNNIVFTDYLPNGGLFFSEPMQIVNGIQVTGRAMDSSVANLILFNIPVGISSFEMAVDIPSNLSRWSNYCNKAILNNFYLSNPSLFLTTISSDDPSTPVEGDPTCVVVKLYENCCNGIDDDGDGLCDADDPDCN